MLRFTLYLMVALTGLFAASQAAALGIHLDRHPHGGPPGHHGSWNDHPGHGHGHRPSKVDVVTLDFEASADTLTLEVSVNRGKLARIKLATEAVDGGLRTPIDAGTLGGDGVDVKRIKISDSGWVHVYFKSSSRRPYLSSGQVSDPFYITYDELETGDTLLACCWQRDFHRPPGVQRYPIEVPEPGTPLLVAAGLVALGLRPTRRR